MRSDAQRLAVQVAVLVGALALLVGGFLIVLGVRSVVAGPGSAIPAAAPNPGHGSSEIGGLRTDMAALAAFAPPQSSGADTLSITLVLFDPEYGECGDVSINGVVSTTNGYITRLAWDWGDGTVIDSWFPASHHYSSNGTYLVQVTAYSSADETKSETTTAAIINAQDPGCDYTFRVHPATIVLRDGKTTENLRLEIRGANGELISPIGRQAVFTSSNPSVVQVNPSGEVTSTAFGEAEIEVTVAGIPRKAVAKVIAGHFRVEPPILLLSVEDEPTGTLTLNVGLLPKVSTVHNDSPASSIRTV